MLTSRLAVVALLAIAAGCNKDAPPAAPRPTPVAPAEAKPATPALEEAKPAETKPEEAKPAPVEAKPAPVEAKPEEAKPAQPAPVEAKPEEAKPEEAKPAEPAPAEAKPEEARPAEPAPAEAKPAEPAPVEAKPAEAKPAEPAPAEAKPTDPAPAVAPVLDPGFMPFEFPVMEATDALAGERVFALNWTLIQNDLAAGKKDDFSTQYLICTMGTPGERQSTVHFVDDAVVPNSTIIRIPPGATAKKGDIVAGVWAVNLTRGVVTDASNPKAPKVRFIGLDYDNPAKADDGKTGIGVFAYTLKEGEFIVISEPYDPGSACAFKKPDGGGYGLLNLFRTEGDFVMGQKFAGALTSMRKTDCLPLPVRPTYKVGATVWAPWVGNMAKGKITKVDTGRYNVKFEDDFRGERMVSFGEVIDVLP